MVEKVYVEAPLRSNRNCIIFSTADWDEPYWTNKQHCAVELARLGLHILYVESVGLRAPSLRSKRDWRRLLRRFKRGITSLVVGASVHEYGISVLSPMVIPGAHKYPVTRRLNELLLRLGIWRYKVGKKVESPIIWTYHPYMLDLIKKIEHKLLLYHCVDDLSAVPGIDKGFKNAEESLLKRADIVFTTAKALFDKCKEINKNTFYLSNVVDFEHFCSANEAGDLPLDLSLIPEPRLIYHGVLSDFKIDFKLIAECAMKKSEWSWVFIGEEREGQLNETIAELKKMTNVYFLGYRSYSDLPKYLRGMNVGLLPSILNEYTHGMFPMKYYEYISAGIPVVSTPLTFTKDEKIDLEVGSDANSFIAAIIRQLNKGRLSSVKSREIVGDSTWKSRTKKMLDLLNIG